MICSYKGEDFENPGDLGTVLKVCKKQKLVPKKGEKHPDGTVGHIFVLTYKKQKKGSGNLASKSILFVFLYDFFVVRCVIKIPLSLQKC